MEAIKPGCTMNQWVRSHLRRPTMDPLPPTPPDPSPGPTPVEEPGVPVMESLPPVPPRPYPPARRPHGNDEATTGPNPMPPELEIKPPLPQDEPPPRRPDTLPRRGGGLAPPVPPPRPEFTKQSSEGTYVPAHLLHPFVEPSAVAAAVSSQGPWEETTNQATKEGDTLPRRTGDGLTDHSSPPTNNYVPIITTMDEEGRPVEEGVGRQMEEMMKELSSQFSPVQIDLLVQMFKTWTNPLQRQQRYQQQKPKRQQEESRDPERGVSTLSVANAPVEPASPLTHRHMGYAKEGQTDPYFCVADIVMQLQEMESDGEGEKEGERRGGGEEKEEMSARERARDKRRGIYFPLHQLLDKTAVVREKEEEEAAAGSSEQNLDYVSNSFPPPKLSRRRNAMRGRSRSSMEGSEHLYDTIDTQTEAPIKEEEETASCRKPVSKLSEWSHYSYITHSSV